jgi:hypothetical protein
MKDMGSGFFNIESEVLSSLSSEDINLCTKDKRAECTKCFQNALQFIFKSHVFLQFLFKSRVLLLSFVLTCKNKKQLDGYSA